MKTNVLRHVSEIKDLAAFRRAPNRACAEVLFKPSLTDPAEEDPTILLLSLIYPRLYCDIKQNVSKCARVLSYSSRRGERGKKKPGDGYGLYSAMKNVPACG